MIPMNQPIPTVYIVDDDVSVRESLELLFTSVGWRSELFDTAQAFLSRARVPCPSCLVLDVQLPDLNGLELQRRVATGELTMPVIFITAYGDVRMTVRALKAGALQFLTKPINGEDLLNAVREAIAISMEALHHAESMRGLRERYESLSRREREVMMLVTSGLLNKQVGGELGISEITVKAHRGNVMRKMGVRSLAQLVTLAAELQAPHTFGRTSGDACAGASGDS
jgi:FixJ family two-component response regulator